MQRTAVKLLRISISPFPWYCHCQLGLLRPKIKEVTSPRLEKTPPCVFINIGYLRYCILLP